MRVALVGASKAPHKYGAIILRNLVRKGYDVRPVNPKEVEIDGLACSASLADVPGPIDIVNLVVPPSVAGQVVDELPAAPGPLLWFQPGAFDASAVEAAQAKGYVVVAGPCIMVETP